MDNRAENPGLAGQGCRRVHPQTTGLLFFCSKKVAIAPVSGIITTNLGKTATPIKIAGREKTDTSLQNMPFSQTGEGHFFWATKIDEKSKINYIKQSVRKIPAGFWGIFAGVVEQRRHANFAGDGIGRGEGAK